MNDNKQKAALIGGDLRMIYAGSALCGAGYRVSLFANGSRANGHSGGFSGELDFPESLEGALENSGLIILPVPLTRDSENLNCPYCRGEKISLLRLISKIKASRREGERPLIFAGGVKKDAGEIFRAEGLELVDYAARESFSQINASYTAEAAFALAVENCSKALCDCRCAVFGCGRIGKRLAALLIAAGAEVTLFSRDPERARGDYMKLCGGALPGFCGYGGCPGELGECDILFNTVPDPSAAAHFPHMKKSSLIIELAGIGVKDDNILSALSLPARFSPESAGALTAKEILSVINEKGSDGK